MNDDAILVHAALKEGGMTETEIATATGLSLIRTKFALDELAVLTVAYVVAEEDGLEYWRLRQEAVR